MTRLRVARLSFGSVRAVELMSTLLVFLVVRCHRILGIRRIRLAHAGSSVGLPRGGFGSLSRYRFAFVSLCAIIVETFVSSSELDMSLLR